VVHRARRQWKEHAVRVRRRRRRILGVVIALVYVGAFVWLVSPVLGPAKPPTSKRPPILEVGNRPVGVVPLGTSKPLPTSLPGSNAVATEPEAGGTEPVSETEGEAEATAVVPESNEVSASPSAGTESSSPPPSETIISSEG
jgi:hypothetical protein